jgi:L-alanine-DL-glutamate epimerase-like enolase superfamily enzyme
MLPSSFNSRKEVSIMMIREVETYHFKIPLHRTLTDAMHGEMTHFEVIMVKISTEEGLEGIGYTYTIGVGGEAVHSLIEQVIKPLLIYEDASRIENLWEKMWWKLHYIGRGGLVSFAISAVDIALWDLRGKASEQPLWKLLGGSSRKIMPYAGGIDLYFSLDELIAQTEKNLEAGFKAIKMKVGREKLYEDIERVAAVRKHIGKDTVLMVDANMRWKVDTAIKAARTFRDYDVYWLEEPTIPDDYEGHGRIEREGGIAVAAGENLHTIYEFRQMIERGGISFPEPDVSNCGGITGWMRVARLAYAFNRAVTSHGVHELHLHLLAAVPNSSYLELHGFGLERFMKDPPPIEDGYMVVPDTPGHGVQFEWDVLEEHRVKAASHQR